MVLSVVNHAIGPTLVRTGWIFVISFDAGQ